MSPGTAPRKSGALDGSVRSGGKLEAMSQLTWALDRKDGRTQVVLTGEITEDIDFASLAAQLRGDVAFDLEGVNRINSTGVREWINFVRALGKENVSFTLERCSLPFVNQLNMISNFRGTGRVRSVFAPWYCSKCQAQHLFLLDCEENPAPHLEQEKSCPTCASPMVFDDIPEAFLSFRS